MITREQLEEALDCSSFSQQEVDHDVIAISLLRERIPYEECKSILQGAGHDILYLCDVDVLLQHLSEEDAKVLGECNCFVNEESDCLALFV